MPYAAYPQVTNGNLRVGGNRAAYTLARLNRDHPDLAARVRAGELSANAAGGERCGEPQDARKRFPGVGQRPGSFRASGGRRCGTTAARTTWHRTLTSAPDGRVAISPRMAA